MCEYIYMNECIREHTAKRPYAGPLGLVFSRKIECKDWASISAAPPTGALSHTYIHTHAYVSTNTYIVRYKIGYLIMGMAPSRRIMLMRPMETRFIYDLTHKYIVWAHINRENCKQAFTQINTHQYKSNTPTMITLTDGLHIPYLCLALSRVVVCDVGVRDVEREQVGLQCDHI